MKCTKAAIHRKFHTLPRLRFNDEKLTSFAGIVLWQSLFQTLDVRASLTRCFSHLRGNSTYGHGLIMLLLIIHLESPIGDP